MKIIKIFPILLLVLYSLHLSAQQMIININNPLNLESVDLDRLESLFILSNMPKIQADILITEDRGVDIEAIKNMRVTKLLLVVTVKDILEEKFLTSKNFTFTGSGKTSQEALKNALSKIYSNGNTLRNFLEKTNNTTANPSCEQAEPKINQLINEGKTKKPLQLATQIAFYCPQIHQIYEQTFEKILILNCEKYLLNSKAYAANKEFEKAVSEVLLINPASPCYQNAKKQLDEISKDYDVQTDKLYKMYLEVRQDRKQYQDFMISLLILNKD